MVTGTDTNEIEIETDWETSAPIVVGVEAEWGLNPGAATRIVVGFPSIMSLTICGGSVSLTWRP